MVTVTSPPAFVIMPACDAEPQITDVSAYTSVPITPDGVAVAAA